jgi:hypothetical protein
MLRNAIGFAVALALASTGAGVYRWVSRVAGHRRFGRGAAHVAAGMIYGAAMGALLALTNDGWHRGRGLIEEQHFALIVSLAVGVGLGAIFGLGWFFQAERSRGAV